MLLIRRRPDSRTFLRFIPLALLLTLLVTPAAVPGSERGVGIEAEVLGSDQLDRYRPGHEWCRTGRNKTSRHRIGFSPAISWELDWMSTIPPTALALI